jgi:hypothetical protein
MLGSNAIAEKSVLNKVEVDERYKGKHQPNQSVDTYVSPGADAG